MRPMHGSYDSRKALKTLKMGKFFEKIMENRKSQGIFVIFFGSQGIYRNQSPHIGVSGISEKFPR